MHRGTDIEVTISTRLARVQGRISALESELEKLEVERKVLQDLQRSLVPRATVAPASAAVVEPAPPVAAPAAQPVAQVEPPQLQVGMVQAKSVGIVAAIKAEIEKGTGPTADEIARVLEERGVAKRRQTMNNIGNLRRLGRVSVSPDGRLQMVPAPSESVFEQPKEGLID